VVRWWRRLDIHEGWLAAGGTVLLLLLLVPMEGWLLRLQHPARALVIIQQRLYRLGHRWDLARAGALTPHEFAGALAARLEPFAGTPRLSKLITSIRRNLDWLTGLYVRNLYAEQAPSRAEGRQAVRAWLGLKRRVWWLRLRLWRKA
jgi:hypothetical protein